MPQNRSVGEREAFSGTTLNQLPSGNSTQVHGAACVQMLPTPSHVPSQVFSVPGLGHKQDPALHL